MPEKILCRFHTQGNCRYGSCCRFSHDLTNVPSQVCSYFLAGHCAYGSKCYFAHVQPDGTPVPGEEVELPQRGEPDSQSSSTFHAEEPGAVSQQSYAHPGRADAAWDDDEAKWACYPDDTYHSHQDQEDDYEGGTWDYGTADDPLHAPAWEGQEVEASGTARDIEQRARERRLPIPVDLGDAWRSGSSCGGSDNEHGEYAEYGQYPEEYEGGWQESADAAEQYYEEEGAAIGSTADDDPHSLQTDPSGVLALTLQLQAYRGCSGRQEQDLCPDYSRSGFCSRGAGCSWIHGVHCNTCQKYALHPTNAERRAEHASECLRRHQRIQALAMSQEVECNICMDMVMAKERLSERKFGLLSCDHAFCLGCIRSWRSNVEGGADVSTALRTCPVCRQTTHFVTPSMTWPTSQEDKAAIVNAYKAKLSQIDCRHFAHGEGSCPFGTSCMYRHAYPNGQLEERTFRKRLNAEGEVEGVQSSRLSDFVATSLQMQQAVRRALRRSTHS